MKKILLISLLALLSMSQAVAQDYEYVPFVREDVKWVYHHVYYSMYGEIPGMAAGVVKATLELKGDTVINGKTYKAMHKYHGDAINVENDTIVLFLREDDKIVYGIVPNGIVYPDCKIGCGLGSILQKVESGEEFILYNFKDPQQYYENLVSGLTKYTYYSYLYTDTVTLGGTKRARHMFHVNYNWPMAIIEGIGYASPYMGYTLDYIDSWPMSGPYFYTFEFEENNENILPSKYDFYKYIFEDDFLDWSIIPDRGKKWVNERVKVNHGDTTCMYYTYEFKNVQAVDPYLWNYYHCLYHEADGSETSSDSVIAELVDRFNPYPQFINNKAFAAIASQNRNMIDFTVNNVGGQFLYIQHNDSLISAASYYKTRQREPFLNDDNLVEIEPLVIDDYTCRRYAYLDENGEPLAYVVEGIGFDSYDMGDLLTPFTRKPDPNADYQEWCGLSHVVKDGQIIYKGMRYREGAYDGIDEVVADQRPRHYDGNYYDLTGRCMGTEVPTTPGIYIHNGNKICVSRMP